MSFTEAIKHVFNNYANFSGRARRSEYWWFVLLNSLVSTALSRLAQMGDGSTLFTALASLWSLALLIPGLAVTWRRLHDIGKSGWWSLLGCNLIGMIVLIVWLSRAGDTDENLFGADPHPVCRY